MQTKSFWTVKNHSKEIETCTKPLILSGSFISESSGRYILCESKFVTSARSSLVCPSGGSLWQMEGKMFFRCILVEATRESVKNEPTADWHQRCDRWAAVVRLALGAEYETKRKILTPVHQGWNGCSGMTRCARPVVLRSPDQVPYLSLQLLKLSVLRLQSTLSGCVPSTKQALCRRGSIGGHVKKSLHNSDTPLTKTLLSAVRIQTFPGEICQKFCGITFSKELIHNGAKIH